ncbi:MAG TPA: 6-phosphogluconolactonase [Gemmatimonadales bacterium]|jgi:6-phosphogluconolactonase
MTEGGPAERNVFVREPPELFALAAKWIRGAMNTGLNQGSCSIALAGGSTPRPVYALLAAEPIVDQIDWRRVSVYFGDERAVPMDSPDSNYAMARDVLISRVPIPATQVHRMEAERADIDAAARDYDRQLPEALDVLILGVGPDGHTASIFPGSSAMSEMHQRVVPVTNSPKPPQRRLTITPPVIEAARAIVVIATGAEKARVIARALDGPDKPRELPLQFARRGAWFLDTAAAAALRGVTP